MALSKEVQEQAVKDLVKYKEENGLNNSDLARKLNCSSWTVAGWLCGRYLPRKISLKKLIKCGITAKPAVSREAVQKQAVTRALVNVDEGNKVPRRYRRRIAIPNVVVNQLKLQVEDYIGALAEPRTYAEFNELRDEFINKLYYTCQQGG